MQTTRFHGPLTLCLCAPSGACEGRRASGGPDSPGRCTGGVSVEQLWERHTSQRGWPASPGWRRMVRQQRQSSTGQAEQYHGKKLPDTRIAITMGVGWQADEINRSAGYFYIRSPRRAEAAFDTAMLMKSLESLVTESWLCPKMAYLPTEPPQSCLCFCKRVSRSRNGSPHHSDHRVSSPSQRGQKYGIKKQY